MTSDEREAPEVMDGSSSHDRYAIYTSINSGWQTRILELHPGVFGEPIIAGLHVIDLIQNPGAVLHERQERIHYQALSYCWVELCSETNRDIYCNGIAFSIRENLFAGLQRVRKEESVVFLWVDAICINQADPDERSGQVANMLNIYMKAQGVIAWLGEPYGFGQAQSVPLIMSMRRIYNKLRANPWFKRVWVKQEVWAAESITVKYGSKTISWQNLTNAGLGQDLLRPGKTARHTIKEYDRPRNDYLTEYSSPVRGCPTDLLDLLFKYAGSQCSDPRDSIYGLLGMSAAPFHDAYTDRHSQQDALVVDYNSTIRDVFLHLAEYFLRRDRHLGILYLNAPRGSTHSTNLPSWVPDWTKLNFGELSASLKYPLFAAVTSEEDWHHKLKMTPLSQGHALVRVSAGVLKVKGWIMGKISDPTIVTFGQESGMSLGNSIQDNCYLTTLCDVGSYEPFKNHYISFLKCVILRFGPDRIKSSFVFDPSADIRDRNGSAISIWDLPPTLWLPFRWKLSPSARGGDIMAFVQGGSFPIILRPQETSDTYTYIGPAAPDEDGNSIAVPDTLKAIDQLSLSKGLDSHTQRGVLKFRYRIMAEVSHYLEKAPDLDLQDFHII